MRRISQFHRKIVFALLLFFIGFLTWYVLTYSMNAVIPFEVNKPNCEAKVLIASQGSKFKDSLVINVLKHYQKDPICFKIIDAYILFTVNIEKWDALLIVNSWEYGSPPKNVKKFIRSQGDQLDKLIILSTVGSYHMVLKDVASISGESIMEKVPDYTKIVVKRLDKILNKQNEKVIPISNYHSPFFINRL